MFPSCVDTLAATLQAIPLVTGGTFPGVVQPTDRHIRALENGHPIEKIRPILRCFASLVRHSSASRDGWTDA